MRALAFAALALSTPAVADVHPRYHEAAKAAAAHVVIMTIDTLSATGVGRDGMGDCTLRGRVETVERGSLLASGQPLTVTVPCYVERAQLPSSGIQWQSVEQLRQARSGRVWLDAQGAQVGSRYFQILP